MTEFRQKRASLVHSPQGSPVDRRVSMSDSGQNHPDNEFFVDAAVASSFLGCSRKHLLKLSIAGLVPAYPLPGTGQRRTWRYLLSELRLCMLHGLGQPVRNEVRSAAGGSRKGGQ